MGHEISGIGIKRIRTFSTVESASAATYTVQSGDSLWKIANHHGVSYQTLMNLNHLSSSNIYVGQKLTIHQQLSTTPNAVQITSGRQATIRCQIYIWWGKTEHRL